MRGIVPVAFCLLSFASACAEPEDPALATPTVSSAPYGDWKIVAVNGVPVKRPGAEETEPSVRFTPTRYGGSSGCNGYGGVGVWAEGRWYGEWPVATQRACPSLSEQERLIFLVMAQGPRFEVRGEPDQAALVAEGGTLELRRAPASSAQDPDPLPRLAGMTWRVAGIDGQPFNRDDQRLSFDAARWEFRDMCGRFGGRWSQQGQAISLSLDPLTQDCATGSPRPIFEALSVSGGRVSMGPNKEVVLAGGGHWIVGVPISGG